MTSSGARLIRGLGAAAAIARHLGFSIGRRRPEQELLEVQRRLASELAATQPD